MDKSVVVLIADDHTLFRQALTKIVNKIPLVAKVVEAGDGAEAIAVCKAQQPDIALLDIQMPIKTGFDVLVQLKDDAPNCKPIMLSMHSEVHFVKKAYQLGAHGYLKKDCDLEELTEAINSVVEGKKYFDKDVKEALFDYLVDNNPTAAQNEVQLSEREGEVLALLCKQKNTGEISNALNISEETVKTHRKSLLKKTNSKNVAGLVVFGIKNGYFST